MAVDISIIVLILLVTTSYCLYEMFQIISSSPYLCWVRIFSTNCTLIKPNLIIPWEYIITSGSLRSTCNNTFLPKFSYVYMGVENFPNIMLKNLEHGSLVRYNIRIKSRHPHTVISHFIPYSLPVSCSFFICIIPISSSNV